MGKGVEIGPKTILSQISINFFALVVWTSGFAWHSPLELFGLLFGRKKKVSFGSEQADRPVAPFKGPFGSGDD